MSIDPGEASASTSTNAADPRRKISPPSALSLGIIVWIDDPEVEPTVIAGRNPVVLARVVAVTIHEMLEDSEAYAGATEFLQSNPPPQDWVLPEDVDAWLEALREATPYPAYSFHHVPMTGGADGTNHTVVNRYLWHALQEREDALTPDSSPSSVAGQSSGRHLAR
ncbi:MAG: hypothetical protein ACTH34_12890 [Microbacterium gubbeenense]|uniref:hypothetical protein n=1 Tax=Microbacterium gubbeenense TaxID=159896 RepID=UPI000416E64A|nr:hypothetical protein [Microbacterium gubbeenense]